MTSQMTSQRPIIYLNFSVNSGTSVTGGHRSSNGWVTSWVDYTNYRFTVSTKEILISLDACNIINEFRSKYKDSSEDDHDWGVYIEDSSYRNTIDISSLIQSLNKNQSYYGFQQSDTPQEFDVSELISYSKKDYYEAVNVITKTDKELTAKIKSIRDEYEILTLKHIYPYLRNLVNNGQVNLQIPFANLDYYPLDIICLNGDIELLIKIIIGQKELKYKCINEIYTFLMTSNFSYVYGSFDEEHHIKKEKVLNFIKELETQFGNETYGTNIYGNHQNFKPKLLKGMLDTAMYYLLKSDYENFQILLLQPIYNRQHYIFESMLKFAYLSDAKWEKFTFSKLYRSPDYEFFEKRIFGSICTHTYWKPFLEKILSDENIIAKLAQIFFFKDEEFSKDRLVKRLSAMIDNCNSNHENYPYFW